MLWLTLLSASLARPPSATVAPEKVRRELEKNDEFLQGFFLAGETLGFTWYNDPGQGQETRDFELTGIGSEAAYRALCAHSATPVFRGPGPGSGWGANDYDPDGHLVVWRNLSIVALIGPQDATMRTGVEGFTLGPDGVLGRVESTKDWAIRQPRTPDYPAVVTSLGRGFSSDIDRVLKVVVGRDEGPYEVLATGGFGGKSGVWRLLIEPGTWLVRRAEFARSESEKASVIVENTGQMKAPSGAVVAAEGTIRYPMSGDKEMFLTTKVVAFDSEPSGELLQEVRDALHETTQDLPVVVP